MHTCVPVSKICTLMNTLNLQQAADLLKMHPVTLQGKVKAGIIPGCKMGRRWVFIEIDLIEHMRAQYKRRALQGERKERICHSINAKTRPSGGSKSASVDEQYNAVLGLKTKSKPKNTMTR
ncbi:MAG: helix-turn-helix domain-containing protein [Methylophilaceae bacterium]